MARLLLATVMALLALQGCCADLQDIADQVHATTQGIVDNVQNTVESVETNVVNQAQAEYTKIDNAVTTFVQSITSRVQKAVGDAEAKGAAVIHCAETVPSSVVALAKDLTTTAYHCVADPVEEGKDIVVTAISLAQQANATVAGISPAVTDCSKKILLEQGLCVTAVYVNAGTSLAGIAAKVTETVTKATTLVTTFKSRVTTCEAGVAARAPVQGEAIITNAESCLQAAIAATAAAPSSSSSSPTSTSS